MVLISVTDVWLTVVIVIGNQSVLWIVTSLLAHIRTTIWGSGITRQQRDENKNLSCYSLQVFVYTNKMTSVRSWAIFPLTRYEIRPFLDDFIRRLLLAPHLRLGLLVEQLLVLEVQPLEAVIQTGEDMVSPASQLRDWLLILLVTDRADFYFLHGNFLWRFSFWKYCLLKIDQDWIFTVNRSLQEVGSVQC